MTAGVYERRDLMFFTYPSEEIIGLGFLPFIRLSFSSVTIFLRVVGRVNFPGVGTTRAPKESDETRYRD